MFDVKKLDEAVQRLATMLDLLGSTTSDKIRLDLANCIAERIDSMIKSAIVNHALQAFQVNHNGLHRGKDMNPVLCQQAWYYVQQFAVTHPDARLGDVPPHIFKILSGLATEYENPPFNRVTREPGASDPRDAFRTDDDPLKSLRDGPSLTKGKQSV